ncbi:tail protein [Streptomyces acidiscabies]|uniref:Phage tail protein n=1 Tax=Streptomyces acidiscabies TaxID=42234 RepID=A0AAP6BD05_9ACTN|nr:tail protein [Streptomyces acidiscabies]MBZ3909424.1 phage tail protein [Streptomyces acidiscabies]MDX2962409.1 phage tail protein [Streptomyces acidiscabies]MDX3792428.1 phage tail protein [Streptomyces acidiscabies]
MAISRVTKLYAVEDCKIFPLLSDPDGGTPSYAAGIDVPGIKALEISGDVEVKELRGDNGLLDSDSSISNITVSWPHAKLSMDVLVALMDSTVTDSGATPSQTTKWKLKKGAKPKPFKIEAKTPTSGGDLVGGDVHFALLKCIMSSFPGLGLAEEDYKTPENEARAVPLISTGDWIDVTINETATAIATAATP